MNIGGKERPFKFSLNAIMEFADSEEMTIEQVITGFGKIGIKKMLKMMYYGFKWGAKSEGLPIDFTQEDVNDWAWENMEMMGKLISQSLPKPKNPKAPQKTGQ